VTLAKLGIFKLSVWCPHCSTPHTMTGKEASVVQLHAAATPGQLEQERKNVNNALICLS
jgi:hypothetical protein